MAKRFYEPVKLIRNFYGDHSVGRRKRQGWDDEPYGCECGLTDANVLAWCREAWNKASPGQRRTLEQMWRQPGWKHIKGTYAKDEARVNKKMRDHCHLVHPPTWRIRVAVWRTRPNDGNVCKWVFGVD